jgi:flagellar biosynthesis protein FlhA
VRRKFAQEVGFLPPPVHVRDNLELKPSGYRISSRGVNVGVGEAFPGMYLAINPGGITTPLIGTATTDPAFGLPAHWIDERQKEVAQMAGFTVVDSETVMATHLSHLMQVHAAKLLSRTETQQLVDHVAKLAPKLIEEVVPKMVSIAVFQKVLQLLLEESVHIRDIRTIIETIAEHAVTISDPVELARRVRIALSPAIVQQIYGPARELNVIAIDPPLERLLVQALGNASGPALDPGVADMLGRSAADMALKQEEIGLPACLLVPDAIRNAIARLVRRVAPRLQVLAHSEIPETHTIRIGPILRGAPS